MKNIKVDISKVLACADPEILSEGVQLRRFLADEGREDQNTTISGSSLSRQRNAIKMAFRWCADDGLTLKKVSMIRKYRNQKLQTNPWQQEEEPHNNHETPGRHTK